MKTSFHAAVLVVKLTAAAFAASTPNGDLEKVLFNSITSAQTISEAEQNSARLLNQFANAPSAVARIHASMAFRYRNDNPLDCRRENLVIKSVQQRLRGTRKIKAIKGKPTSSRFKGVYWHGRMKRWYAAIKFQGATILDKMETLISPGRSIPFRVQRLTGITPQHVADAPGFESISRPLQQFLGDYPIVGHSIPFDVGFLRRRGLVRNNPLIDTFELATVLLPSLPWKRIDFL